MCLIPSFVRLGQTPKEKRSPPQARSSFSVAENSHHVRYFPKNTDCFCLFYRQHASHFALKARFQRCTFYRVEGHVGTAFHHNFALRFQGCHIFACDNLLTRNKLCGV